MLAGLVGKSGLLTIEDSYELSSPQKVIFNCPNKNKKVTSILSGPISFSIQSHWESWLATASGVLPGGNIANLLDPLDTASQLISATSIRQPWFGRKTWKGTDPFSFDIPVVFQATTSPKDDVWVPLAALLSFLYPRIKGFSGWLGEKATELLGNLISTYEIPGPSILYPYNKENKEKSGDVVEVSIGNFLFFEGCYLESTNVEIPPTFGPDGFPLYAKVNVKVTVMDTNYVSADGSFLTNGFAGALIDGGKLSQLMHTVEEKMEAAWEEAKSGLGDLKPDPSRDLLSR